MDETAQTLATIEQFNEAFNRHDVEGMMNAMTDDCVFDNIRPRPDGEIFEGQAAVRAYWEMFFERSPHARFEAFCRRLSRPGAGIQAVSKCRRDPLRAVDSRSRHVVEASSGRIAVLSGRF